MKGLSYLGIGAAGLAVAPSILPALSSNPMVDLASMNALQMCSSGGATGLAGSVAGLLAGVPLIGAGLAAGGFMTIGVAAAISIGGLWLANHVDKKTPEGAFKWGSVIRWAAMGTSVLVSLPTLLPAISMGLNFLSFWLQPGVSDTALLQAGEAIGKLGTDGAFSGAAMANNGAALGLVHAFTCALPLGIGAWLAGRSGNTGYSADAKPPTLTMPERAHEGRVQTPALGMGHHAA